MLGVVERLKHDGIVLIACSMIDFDGVLQSCAPVYLHAEHWFQSVADQACFETLIFRGA